MARKRPARAWIIYWAVLPGGPAQAGVRHMQVVGVLSSRRREPGVLAAMRVLYATVAYTPDEQLAYREQGPYEPVRVAGDRLYSCGHNPMLMAVLAANVRRIDGQEAIEWEEEDASGSRHRYRWPPEP
jgi:hypothetical protein